MPIAAFQALTAPEIEEIHQATLRLLVDPGIRVSDPPLHDLLIQAGCRGGAAAQWVRFPAGLVEELLGQVPRRFPVSGAGGGQAYEVGAGRTYAASGFFGTAMLEPGQGERSALTLGDVTRFVRVAEALENIDFQAVPGLPQDVDQARALGAALREMLAYSAKPLLVAPFDERDAALVLAMMEAVQPGGQTPPRWICQQSMRSPLTLPPDMGRVMRRIIPCGVPMLFHTAPQTGASAPYTLAGLLVQYNVEMVAALVSAQVLRRGAACVYGGGWGTSDLMKLQRHLGTPESALMRVAGVQMARRYGVPCHSLGPDTDAMAADQRGAWEKLLTCLANLGAGVDIMPNSGMFATGMHLSLAQLVMDDEIVGCARRFARGITVDPERMAEAVIRDAGPEGRFLDSPHTLAHLRGDEHRRSRLCRTETYPEWLSRGAPSAAQDALDEAQRILREPCAPVLPEQLRDELENVIEGFAAEG